MRTLHEKPAAYLLRVPVGCFRRLFQLAIGLIQKVFCFLSMAGQIPLVGLLGSHNFFVSLRGEPLGRGEVGVTPRGDVTDRLLG